MNPITITGRDVARGINELWTEGTHAASAQPVFTTPATVTTPTVSVCDYMVVATPARQVSVG